MGVAFKASGGWQQGIRVCASLGLHNACEGLAMALVLTSSGFSHLACVFWTIATHLPQVLGALVFFVGAQYLAAALPLLLGWAGALILYIVFTDMLPEATESMQSSGIPDARSRTGLYILLGIASAGVLEVVQDLQLGGTE